MTKFTGTYAAVVTLTKEQLKAKLSVWPTARDQAFVKAARYSLEHDNQTCYVEVTYTNVFWGIKEPAFNTSHYRVIGNQIERYIP